MIFERSGARSVVGLAHDVPQNPFWLSRSFQAAIAAAFAGGRSRFHAINGCPNIALTTRPPVTPSISSSRNSRSSSLVLLMIFLHSLQARPYWWSKSFQAPIGSLVPPPPPPPPLPPPPSPSPV